MPMTAVLVWSQQRPLCRELRPGVSQAKKTSVLLTGGS
jgi:hypothetical protein